MSNIQTGAERMPHDLSHLGFLAGQIGRLITISTTPVIAGDSFEMDRSEERFSRNAETDLVCRLLLEKKKQLEDTTGISARDRAPTVHVAIDPDTVTCAL